MEVLGLVAALSVTISVGLIIAWAVARRRWLAVAAVGAALASLVSLGLFVLAPDETCRFLGGTWQWFSDSCSQEWGGLDGGLFI